VSRTGKFISDPRDPLAISEAVSRLQTIVDNEIEFGNPLDPNDSSSTTAPGDTAGTPQHNGTLQNIRGSWVEVEFDGTGAANYQDFHHNMGLPEGAAGEPNVRWLCTNFRHSGAGAVGASTLSLEFDDSVAAPSNPTNTIRLVLRAEGTRTIAAGANAVKVSVFFIPAVRWV
jgi:hypothetical protein